MTRDRLALRVELQQLLRHVAHRSLDARLGFFPSRAAQAIERGTTAAGVLLNEVEPLDRDEELVVAVIAKLEKLLRVCRRARQGPPRRIDLLQADKFADAVIDVNDQVADLEVAQIGQERLRKIAPLLRRSTLLFEDVGLGVNLQRSISEPESTREEADGNENGRGVRVLRALDRDGDDLVFLEDLDRAFRAAVALRDEQDRVASLARLPDLGDPVVDAAAEFHRRLTANMSDRSAMRGEPFGFARRA